MHKVRGKRRDKEKRGGGRDRGKGGEEIED